MKSWYGLLLLPALAFAETEAPAWTQHSESWLGFEASAQGERFEGRFARFEAAIRFDPDALEGSCFEVAIELGSVDSRNQERDDMLREPEFFDSQAQPRAHYRATRFEALGAGRFRADGELSLRGVTRAVPLDFTWQSDAEVALLDGRATLDRLAFAVGDGEWADTELIAREVEVRTRLRLVPATATP